MPTLPSTIGPLDPYRGLPRNSPAISKAMTAPAIAPVVNAISRSSGFTTVPSR
ncbi:hypothetical protein ABIA36_003635 [Leifsonia sp. EB34]